MNGRGPLNRVNPRGRLGRGRGQGYRPGVSFRADRPSFRLAPLVAGLSLGLAPGSVRADEATPAPAGAGDDASVYDRFAEKRSGECVGPAGELERPVEWAVGDRRYRLHGHRLEQIGGKDKDKALRIGVISATKDDRAEPAWRRCATC